jgi:hypothetical protein
MEDRHYLSKPRPVAGLDLPTWEVDVMREGVDTPIMMLTVDDNILPPRKRKKKIVWKLPDDFSILPKFGTEDKKRILEIFKQKKKELKRQRKTQTTTLNSHPQNADDGGGSTDSKVSKLLLQKSSSSDGTKEKDEPVSDEGGNSPAPSGFGMSKLSLTDGVEEKKKKKPLSPKEVPHFEKKMERHPESKPKNLHCNGHSAQHETLRPTQPAASSAAPMQPTPAVTQSPPTGQSRQPGQPPMAVSLVQQPPPGLSSTVSPPGIPIPPPGMASPPLRQFFVPENSTMLLGEFVAKSYYYLLSNKLIEELSQYYTPTAQKSLTVGGAHACCKRVEERAIQLQSLASTVFNLNGFLQQPTVHGSTLVLITGTCVQPHSMSTLPFCHSLVILPVPSGGFQIQNDALAFLTSEG